MLFFKVASSEEEEASVEALKCLGEIGPMNLDSPILQVKVNYFLGGHSWNRVLNFSGMRGSRDRPLA